MINLIDMDIYNMIYILYIYWFDLIPRLLNRFRQYYWSAPSRSSRIRNNWHFRMKFQWNWRLARCHHPWTGRRKVMPWPGEERVWYWLLRRFFFLEVNHPFFPPFFLKGAQYWKMTTKGASWSQFWAERHLKAAKSFLFLRDLRSANWADGIPLQ